MWVCVCVMFAHVGIWLSGACMGGPVGFGSGGRMGFFTCFLSFGAAGVTEELRLLQAPAERSVYKRFHREPGFHGPPPETEPSKAFTAKEYEAGATYRPLGAPNLRGIQFCTAHAPLCTALAPYIYCSNSTAGLGRRGG